MVRMKMFHFFFFYNEEKNLQTIHVDIQAQAI